MFPRLEITRVNWLRSACVTLCIAVCAPAQAQNLPQTATPVYEFARSSLLQVRTLLRRSGQQSSIGSGFIVDAEHGLAITNFHVVAQAAREGQTYRLEYVADGGQRGALTVLGFDVANDLAVVRLDTAERLTDALRFASGPTLAALPQGERLFSLGNPLDLGLTIVEGTYNGELERSVQPRLHFTGAINPGMSGGPALNGDGAVVGVNVAKRMDGEMVSFLVPAAKAVELLDRVRQEPLPDLASYKDEIGRQLALRQRQLGAELVAAGFSTVGSGPYQIPEPVSPWFECWSSTNADEHPTPYVLIDQTQCDAASGVYVGSDDDIGGISVTRSLLSSSELNAFQFSAAVSGYWYPTHQRPKWEKSMTAPHCRDRFVQQDGGRHPPLRLSWCAAAYRDYPDIFSFNISYVTQDRDDLAMVVNIGLAGFDFAAATEFTRAMVENTTWAP